MAEVVLNNVRKITTRLSTRTPLRSINLTSRKGEFIVFVGPSGCGKSTLLPDDRGSGRHHQRRADHRRRYMNDVPPVERNVGMVFQSHALYPHMNIYENMAFGLKLKKMDKENIHKRVMRRRDPGLEPLLDKAQGPFWRSASAGGHRPLHRAAAAGVPV